MPEDVYGPEMVRHKKSGTDHRRGERTYCPVPKRRCRHKGNMVIYAHAILNPVSLQMEFVRQATAVRRREPESASMKQSSNPRTPTVQTLLTPINPFASKRCAWQQALRLEPPWGLGTPHNNPPAPRRLG
eukprot:5427662-Pyramimonas_sp.AAC.1